MREIEKTIRQYLNRSAGNCNHVSDFTIRCFVGMVQTGEVTMLDFQRIGGDYVTDRMKELTELNNWGPLAQTISSTGENE